MIVLDTNVLSEPDKPLPDKRAIDWLDAQLPSALYLTATSVAELAGGAHRILLRSGSSKYLERLRRIVEVEFRERILAFDLHAADFFGRVRAKREAAGRPIGHMDATIAAICLAHDAVLATRNVRDFDGLGLKLVNPFDVTA